MRRGRARQWVAGGWAVLVLLGGGLTLWLEGAGDATPGTDGDAVRPSPASEREREELCPEPSTGPNDPVAACVVAVR